MPSKRPTADASRLTRQQSFDFSEKKRGGARPGAGRPRKSDKERGFIAHRARPSHRKDDPVHVTLRVKRGVPSLRRQSLEKIIKRALVAQRKTFEAKPANPANPAKEAKHFQVVHFTIQSDHLHLIVEAPDKRALARGVAGLEIRIARRLNALLRRKGGLWHERYHRRDLRTPTETRNALRYVLLNAQKHAQVIGSRDFADPFSSAATFDGFTHTPATFVDETPWAWVNPHTWLLRVGWRRYGLLDPAEPPQSARPER